MSGLSDNGVAGVEHRSRGPRRGDRRVQGREVRAAPLLLEALIQERTLAGLEAARARGRHGGRPSSITLDKLAAAAAMRQQNRPMHAIATALGVSRATLYRHLGDAHAS